MIRRHALAASLVALLVPACSSDGSPPRAGEEMVLYPTTKVLDAATLALATEVAPDLSTLTFSGSSAALEGIASGDVVMGGVSARTPHGLLRRITEVTRTGDGVRLTTARAGLGDAIERGRIRLPLTRLRKDGSTTRTASLRPLDVAATSFDEDFTVGLSDIELAPGVKAGASVGFGLGIDLDLEVSAKEVSGKVVLSGSQSATLDLHALVSTKFGKVTPLGGIDFPPIVLQVGPAPIVITSGLRLSVGAEGTTSTQLDWAATEKSAVDVGIKLGTGGVEPILAGDASATSDPVKLHGALDARAFAELKLDVAVNALLVDAAFYVGAQGYARLDVDLARAPCFRMSAGVDGIYGVDTSLLGVVTLVKKDERKNLVEKVWSEGACANDPLSVDPWAVTLAASDLDTHPRAALLGDQSVVVGARKAGTTGYVARLTPDGAPLWESAIDGVVGVSDTSPTTSADGSSWLFGTYDTEPMLARLGPDGVRTAATLVRGSQRPYPKDALFVATKDGGALLGGSTLDPTDTFVTWAAKLDASGKLAWARSYGPVGTPRAIAEANDGGALLAGEANVGPGAALALMRLSPSGDPVVARTYGEGRLYGVTALASGGIAATGATATGEGAVVLRVADDGALVWGFSYEDQATPREEIQGRAVIERADGLLVAGRRGFAASADFGAKQVDAGGALGWSRTYGGDAADEVTGARRTSDGGAVLVGETKSFGATGTHVLLLRVPPSGAFTFDPSSGGASRTVTGAKQPLPGAPTVLTPTVGPLDAVATTAPPTAWPFTPAQAKYKRL